MPTVKAPSALGTATLALLLGLCACQSPKPAHHPPAPAPPPPPPPAPQFSFASWTQAKSLIRAGRVLQTVSGRGGFSLVLDNHTWVHVVATSGDPLPRNPMDFIYRNAPNAAAIKQVHE